MSSNDRVARGREPASPPSMLTDIFDLFVWLIIIAMLLEAASEAAQAAVSFIVKAIS